MEKNEFLDKLQSGQMSRRDFKKALASVGLTLVAIPFVSRAGRAATEDHPVIFTWEGYEEPDLHGSYLEKYGESPNFSFFGDEEEAFAKIRAGFAPDVAMPCSYKIPHWRDAGIIQPIDTSRLSNWADIVPSLKDVPGIVVDGKRHWVCMDWGQTSIIYRTDLVDIEEESWSLLWDERYSGRMSMLDSLIDGVMVAAILAGAQDPFSMTDAEVAKTKALLQKQLPLLRYYANSPTDIQQALASGELVAGVAWNDSYTNLKGEGVPVKFMKPKEGAMTWTCGISIMSSAEGDKLDRAYDFIDAMLSPESGAYEIREFGYGHANRKAYQIVSAEELAERGLTANPDDLLSTGIFQKPITNEPALQAMFEEVKAGL
ncbi:MAG: extracellular solute-binding protein [Rhodospirillales bacterium]|nr:extracellular solute-binding protein [Rhodospirillales bacterium]